MSFVVMDEPGTCPLLEKVPTEVRLAIYEHIVVANEPLKGKIARKGARYGLDLAILRVARQVYREARDVFYARNTFSVSAVPEQQDGEYLKTAGSFEPPLPCRDWPLLRNLSIDLVYYPQYSMLDHANSQVFPPVYGDDWKPAFGCAEKYIQSLTSMIGAATPSLQYLRLEAVVEESYSARMALISFLICERERGFQNALVALKERNNIQTLPFHFEFCDSFYNVEVEPEDLARESMLNLAGKVMFCQSQWRFDLLMYQYQMGEVGQEYIKRDMKGVKGGDKLNLAPIVGAMFKGPWALPMQG
jgi:hypothetical protein